MVPLTPTAALVELLARLGASADRTVTLAAEELLQWPVEAVAAFKAQGVLRPGKPADSAVCPGCERFCVMPVTQRLRPGHPTVAFVVCDKRDDINRVLLEAVHLERWRADDRTLGDALAKLLGADECQPAAADPQMLRLSTVEVRSDKATVHLRFDDRGRVLLEVAGHSLELVHLLLVQGQRLALDSRPLARRVDAPAAGAGLSAETPEQRTERLQARKAVLKGRGAKNFLQVIAQEERLSVSMVKKVLGRAEPPDDAPLPAWVAPNATRQGVSSGGKHKR